MILCQGEFGATEATRAEAAAGHGEASRDELFNDSHGGQVFTTHNRGRARFNLQYLPRRVSSAFETVRRMKNPLFCVFHPKFRKNSKKTPPFNPCAFRIKLLYIYVFSG
jgi:hypothetical protein